MTTCLKSHHPFWNRFNQLKKRGLLCPAWLDFWVFVRDVGDPGESKKMLRLDETKPYGPDNFRWALPLVGERNVAYMREWREKNPNAHRESHLQRKYGISVADYEAMLQAQDGVCAICQGAEHRFTIRKGDAPNRLCVDHDHETGEARGLLCADCNVGLGAFADDQVALFRAIQYLHKHKAGAKVS